MSQRSQVANSGSSPIEQCSAACAEPGQVGGGEAAARRAASSGTVHQTAWVRQRPLGEVERLLVDHLARRAGVAGGTTRPGGRPRPCRARAGRRPSRGARARRTMRDVGQLARRGGVVDLGAVDHRDVLVEVERVDEPGLAAVHVDRAGVGGARGRCEASTVPRTRPVDASTSETGRPPPERMSARSLARLRIGPEPAAGAAPEQPGLGQLVEQRAGGRPEQRAGRPRVSGSSARRRTGAGPRT